jgi:hypothetical protein
MNDLILYAHSRRLWETVAYLQELLEDRSFPRALHEPLNQSINQLADAACSVSALHDLVFQSATVGRGSTQNTRPPLPCGVSRVGPCPRISSGVEDTPGRQSQAIEKPERSVDHKA